MWMSSETPSKVESCRRNRMHFADATKNRSERREAVGVQTEARHGRVDELAPGEGASELAPLDQMGKIAQGKSHDGGTIDPEHRHECTKVQNWKMNQNKQCSGLLRSSPTCSARARSRVKHPAGWLHPGCAWSWHTIGNDDSTPLQWRGCAAQSDSNSVESSWRSWPRKLFENELWDSQKSGAEW